MYDLETQQKKLGPDYHRLKTVVKRSIEQEIRNKNFGARSGNFEKNAVVKNQGTKQRVQRILGDCWQWETNGQCVKGNNCSFRHDMDKRGKSSPSNPSQNSFMQQRERKPSRTRSPRGKSPSGRTSRWPCNNSFCEKMAAMQWITEVELVDSVGELRTSSSIRGISMPNFEVLDARIASALNKIIHNSKFKKENQSGGTKGPERGPFPSRQTDCLLDLRLLPGQWDP